MLKGIENGNIFISDSFDKDEELITAREPFTQV